MKTIRLIVLVLGVTTFFAGTPAHAETYRRTGPVGLPSTPNVYRGLDSLAVNGVRYYSAWAYAPGAPYVLEDGGYANPTIRLNFVDPPEFIEVGSSITFTATPESRHAETPTYRKRPDLAYPTRVQAAVGQAPGLFTDGYIGYQPTGVAEGTRQWYHLVDEPLTGSVVITPQSRSFEVHFAFHGGDQQFNRFTWPAPDYNVVLRWTYVPVTGAPQLSNLVPSPDSPLIPDYEEYRFSADVTYEFSSDSPGVLALQLVSAGGSVWEEVRHNISRTTGPATATMTMAPIQATVAFEGARLRAQILSDNNVQGETYSAPYTVQDDELILRDVLPLDPYLTPGTAAGFSAGIGYRLISREAGEITMDLLDGAGVLISSTGPRLISRSQNSQSMTLSLPPVAVVREMGQVVLRVQMSTGGTILKEDYRRFPVLDPDEQALEVLLVNEGVEMRMPGGDWVPVTHGMRLLQGAEISTGPGASVHLLFPDSSVLVVKEMSDLYVGTLLRQGSAVKARVVLRIGEVAAEVNPAKIVTSDFEVVSPVATASIRGTTLTFRHVKLPEAMSTLTVTEGEVEFIPDNAMLNPVMVGALQTASVTATKITSPNGPSIDQVNPAAGTAGTTQVTLTGTNFSATPEANVVAIAGVAAQVLSASATQLTFIVPDGLPTATEPLTVTVNGYTSNTVNFAVTASHAPTVISGDVSGTWTRALSPYTVNAIARVPVGQTLQIEPGVVVMFDFASMDVWGRLLAPGTAAAPIRFTSANPAQPNWWGGIAISHSAVGMNSELTHCIIEHGAFEGYPVSLVNASPRFDFCTFRSSRGYGLYLNNSDPQFTGCLIAGIPYEAIIFDGPCFPVLNDNLVIGNLVNVISVSAPNLSRSGTWMDDDIPYRLRTDVKVLPSSTLTIEPGTEIQASTATTDVIVQGTLIARGTPGAPISFNSEEAPAAKARGQWGALVFEDSSNDAASVLENCVIEYGGNARNGAIQMTSASPAIRNCFIGGSSTRGIDLSNSQAGITDCTVRDCTLAPIRMTLNSFPVLGNNTAGNTLYNAIDVPGGLLGSSGTWTRDMLPYRISGTLTVPQSTVLTVEDGTVIQLGETTTSLIVSGGLNARGTAAQPIRFTSDEAIKVPGQWGALVFQNGSASSVLEHCIIEYGGAGHNGQLEFLSASPALSDCVIHGSVMDGLFMQNSATAAERCNFINNMRDGIRTDSAGTFAVHNSNIAANGGQGIRNLTTQVLPAQTNYWGHPSGPFDNLNTDGAGRLNPGGLGSRVSEYVNWLPFLNAVQGGGSVHLRFALWKSLYFPNGGAGSGNQDDVDSDGLTTTLEFALRTSPLSPDNATVLPALSSAPNGGGGTDYHFTYTRPLHISGVTYTVQMATSLTEWTALPDYQIGATSTTGTRRATLNSAGIDRVFLRLNVTIAP